MTALLIALLAALRSTVRSRFELEAEIVALRHQLAVLQRQAPRRPRLGRADRLLWVLLSRAWSNWRRAIQIGTPDTVVRWHRRGSALYWWRKSRPRRAGRPAVAADIRALIQQMHAANPLWGAPRIHTPLLHGPHRHVSCVVRVRRVVARPTAHRPRERDGASDRRVDRTTTPRGVALGYRAAVRHPGPRRHLRIRVSDGHAGHGHRTSTDLAPCTLAEPVRGTRDRPPYGASASTTSSYGTNARCAATSSSTWATTTTGEPISRSTRTRPSRVRRSHRRAGPSCKSRTSAVCITTTNVAPPERRSRRRRQLATARREPSWCAQTEPPPVDTWPIPLSSGSWSRLVATSMARHRMLVPCRRSYWQGQRAYPPQRSAAWRQIPPVERLTRWSIAATYAATMTDSCPCSLRVGVTRTSTS
jgi:hypothetical protein